MFPLLPHALAATGIPIAQTMNTIVDAIIAAGLVGIVGGVAWMGIEYASTRRVEGIAPFIPLGIGATLIGAARTIGPALTGGTAAAAGLGPVPVPMVNEVLGEVIGGLLYLAPLVTVGVRGWLWRRRT